MGRLVTIRQRVVPGALLGRVGGVNMVGVYGGLVVGSGIGGVLAQHLGITAPFWFAFVGSAVFVVAIWCQLNHLSSADQQTRPLAVGAVDQAVHRAHQAADRDAGRDPDAGYAHPVLRIPAEMVDAIVAHARADHPDEACGVIAGPGGSNTPTRLIPMTNAERSPTFYRFDSTEQLRLYRELDAADEEVIVVYHSHTATEAYPSRTDISYAGEPQAHYVLVSTREPDSHEFRSYRIVDGDVTEETVEIVPSGDDI